MALLDLAARSEKIRPSYDGQKHSQKKNEPRHPARLDTRIEFMEGIVRRDPDYVDALQLLGDDYTQRGRFPEGLQVDERLASLEPQNSLVFYNLACSYSLTGQFDRAGRAGKGLEPWLPRFRVARQGSGLEKTPRSIQPTMKSRPKSAG